MLRNLFTSVLIFITVSFFCVQVRAAEVQCFFSPHGDCSAKIIQTVSEAKKSIDVGAYELTRDVIGEALIDAAKRGIAIRVILDRGQETIPATMFSKMKSAGIEIRSDHIEKLFHNKYAIVDAQVVLTGSFNWSDNAEQHNAENLVIINDAGTATTFEADFSKHWDHSISFVHRQKTINSRINLRAVLPTTNHFFLRKGDYSWHV